METTDEGIGLGAFRRFRVRSPMINGKTLSPDVLEGDLTTRNLGKIRDLLTGRFFGRTAVKAYKLHPDQMLKWQLGTDGSNNGCGFHAALTPGDTLDNCFVFMFTDENNGDPVIKVSTFNRGLMNTNLITSGPGNSLDCDWHCDSYCDAACGGVHCSGYCEGQATVDIYEFVSYPADKFVSEIKNILGTDDIKIIYSELKNVIFSNEVLNMGLQRVIATAHSSIAESIETSM